MKTPFKLPEFRPTRARIRHYESKLAMLECAQRNVQKADRHLQKMRDADAVLSAQIDLDESTINTSDSAAVQALALAREQLTLLRRRIENAESARNTPEPGTGAKPSPLADIRPELRQLGQELAADMAAWIEGLERDLARQLAPLWGNQPAAVVNVKTLPLIRHLGHFCVTAPRQWGLYPSSDAQQAVQYLQAILSGRIPAPELATG